MLKIIANATRIAILMVFSLIILPWVEFKKIFHPFFKRCYSIRKWIKKERSWNYGLVIRIGVYLAVITIALSLIAPIYFTQTQLFTVNFGNTADIGDTIGGLMNPFIALAAAILTFLAFYMQFEANKKLKDEIRIREEKDQKDQFERQFYKMLELHKANVDELEIAVFQNKITKNIVASGRHTFEYLRTEFEVCYYVVKLHFKTKKLSVSELLTIAYSIFFHGINAREINDKSLLVLFRAVKENHEKNSMEFIDSILTEYEIPYLRCELSYPLFNGYSAQLAHYYRHLYQTVKFVSNSPILGYSEKRNYLRILRAQLSNQEQAMLFYNWCSQFGWQWECPTRFPYNKYFTDYRMVHNVYQGLLRPDYLVYPVLINQDVHLYH
jgi:hypothetical protein